MEWFRIGLAAFITTAVSVGAFDFFHRRQKRREATDPRFADTEKRRAQRIVTDLGTFVVHGIQLAAGLAAGIPAFALLIFLVTATGFPRLTDALAFGSMFAGGWIVFAWCIRITDALDNQQR
jgi:hypothetical protein